ncbi:MAG: phasin family protein [Betaproteobacteria bacterium]
MQNQSQFVDIYRSMARVAAESAKAGLQNIERLHTQQLQVVRGALEQNMRTASQLAEARSVDEVLSVHSQIVGAQIAQAIDVWRTLWRLAGDSQMTFMSQMQTQVGQATDTVRQAYDLTPRAGEAANAPERRPQEQQRKSA